MIKKFLYWIYLFLTVFLLLFFIEKLSKRYIVNIQSKNQNSVKILPRKDDIFDYETCCSYMEIDPLLGWSMTESQLNEKGYKVRNNCVVLENISSNAKDTLVIFLTGGSTTDLGVNDFNWPKYLAEKLKAEKINYVIYNAAVGGYGTSQELLKLLRDGFNLNLDLHLSYNGANDMQVPYFVSYFEENLFTEILFYTKARRIMPYTTYIINDSKLRNNNSMKLKSPPTKSANDQWKDNMKAMYILAKGQNHIFRGILQPVVGINKIAYTSKSPKVTEFVNQYKIFYPQALEFVKETEYMVDFTGVFNNVGQKAFGDDCHILNEYQPILADRVFLLISETLDLNRFK